MPERLASGNAGRGVKAERYPPRRIEEEIFYPARLEHQKAATLCPEPSKISTRSDALKEELAPVGFDDEKWAAQFTMTEENIEHHMEGRRRRHPRGRVRFLIGAAQRIEYQGAALAEESGNRSPKERT